MKVALNDELCVTSSRSTRQINVPGYDVFSPCGSTGMSCIIIPRMLFMPDIEKDNVIDADEFP